MVFNELKNGMDSAEELPFITAQELCEGGNVFTIQNIYIKENVETKFGIKDVAYVTILIDGEKYLVSIKNAVLMKTLRAIKEQNIDVSGSPCVIAKHQGKNSSYYVFEDA